MKKSDELMRQWEADTPVLPQNHIVVRLDGRHFHHLTRDLNLKKPFDEDFRDWMIGVVRHLMTASGFNVLYGYTQSDEISLLLDLDDTTFARSQRKIVSVLAGEASADLSIRLGRHAVFDARISILPNLNLVTDYFEWRQEDSARNSVNGYAFWKMVESGKSKRGATTALDGMKSAAKHEYLFSEHGINWNDIPVWQRRGFGFYWETQVKEGWNPIKQEKVQVNRRVLFVDDNLPLSDSYRDLIQTVATETHERTLAVAPKQKRAIL